MNTKLNIKDIVTAAAMMAIYFIISFTVGPLMAPFPIVYLYACAGIIMFLGAPFYLVAAHRINKHGVLFVWNAVYGIITAMMGYVYMLPYFLLCGVICELVMWPKNSYRNALRNKLGWATYGLAMILGNGVPYWFAWESFKGKASEAGYAESFEGMLRSMITKPHLLLLAILITVTCAVLGIVFAEKLLMKHFKKAGMIE